MNELKCPKCGTAFKIDEKDYKSIVEQVKDSEFEQELKRRENELKLVSDNELKLLETKKDMDINELKNKINSLNAEKENAIKNVETDISKKYDERINEMKIQIEKLNSEIKLKETESKLEIEKALSESTSTINELKQREELIKKEYELSEKNIKESYEEKIKTKDEQIAYYKDFKARQSTKMIGESLEVHCSNEFNKLRPLFSNAYFEKDNDAKTGSKGDFIFRDFDDDGTEIVSIMFEMKNEADETSTKHKNEDFFKELDKDRLEKNCEYAVLVSMLEMDNDYYNNGIVDVSHKYNKMYVVRPQLFIPIITLLRGSAINSLKYKKQLIEVQNQNIDISHFEENMNNFKEGFARNYRIASDKFMKAIEEIDKTIDHLQKTKDALLASENNLRLANKKADELTIKKLTHNSKTMEDMFNEINS